MGGGGRGGKRRRKGRKTPTYTQARDKNRGQRREKKKPKTLKPRIIYKHTSAHEIIPSMHRSACVLSRLLRKTPCKIVRRGVLSCCLYKVCTLNPPPPLTWSFKPCKRPLSSARFWVFFWVSALRALILLQKVPQEKNKKKHCASSKNNKNRRQNLHLGVFTHAAVKKKKEGIEENRQRKCCGAVKK